MSLIYDTPDQVHVFTPAHAGARQTQTYNVRIVLPVHSRCKQTLCSLFGTDRFI